MDDQAPSDHQAQIRDMATRLAQHIRQMERADRAIPLHGTRDPHSDGVGRLTGLVP